MQDLVSEYQQYQDATVEYEAEDDLEMDDNYEMEEEQVHHQME
jgi:hypothetical protein